MTDRRDSHSAFAWGAASAFLIQGMGLLLAWIVQIALARTLSRSDLGIYTSIFALTTTLAVPATLGLPVALVRLLPEYRRCSDWPHYAGVLRGGQWMIFLVGLGIALGTAFVIWLAPASRVADAHGALLLGTVLIPAFALSNLGLQTLRGMGRVAQATWPPMLLQPLLMLTGLVAMTAVHVRLDSRGSVALLAGSTLAALGLQWAMIQSRLREDMGSRPVAPAYEMRRWLRFSFPLLLTVAFQMILAQMDVLTVSVLLSPREVAVYGAAARLSRFISVTQFAVYLALGPSLVEAHARGDLAAVQRRVTSATQWTFWPACAATVVLLFGGRFLLSLYGSGFAGGYLPLCILGLGFWVNAAAGPAMVALNMMEHHAVVTKVSGVTALAGTGLCLLLTWRFGTLGAALASALAMSVWNLWLAAKCRRHLQIQVFALPDFAAKTRRQAGKSENKGVGDELGKH